MIINFDPKHGAEYHGIEQTFRFLYGTYTPPSYGFPEVQQDFIALNAKVDSIITKLPVDYIAGSLDAIALETKHGVDSWKTATGFATPSDVKCGGGGGGGTIIERPDIWKPEEKLKLIDDIKKIYKMINELSSLQSVGLQNVKKNIESLKNSLLKLIKEEVALLVSLKKTISEQQQQPELENKQPDFNLLIAKWDSIQESIAQLKPADFSSLDSKLDELTKIMVKSLSNKALEELVNAE